MTIPTALTSINFDAAMDRLLLFTFHHPDIKLDVGRLIGAILAVQSFHHPNPDATEAERDEVLAAQLERAARAVDSVLLEEAAVRIRMGIQ